MENFYDYKKYKILYVDDEEKSLKYFREIFGEKFTILTAPSPQEGLKLLNENLDSIGLFMTDQRMPGEKGVQLLEKARQSNPRIMRVLVTAYSDLETAIDAVNTGAIYKYVTKPWDIPQLEVTLRRGLEFFMVQSERDQLMREKISALHSIMMTDRILSLGVLAAGLGHHIRNSMVAVKTFLDLTPKRMEEEQIDLNRLRNPDFWKDYYQKVQGQMDKVVSLLGDLWETSNRPLPSYNDKVRLDQVLADALQAAQGDLTARKVQVENQVPGGLPELTVDKAKFQRLFEMLLKDEAVSLPAGSKVKIKASVVGPKEGPAEVLVELEDNGPGIPEDGLRSLFDPFFTRSGSPQEFGIYLMSCFFIVYHHGGRITVKNRAEGGTHFGLAFPVAPPTAAALNEERDLMAKILVNESLWEKLLAGN
ncbi:MAG TPA: response regulator [bacterium]|nr:response regulator [bacterium]